MSFILYIFLLAFLGFDIYLMIKFITRLCYAAIKKQPPLVCSTKYMRNQVLLAINKYYPDAKTICEIGSGTGGLARLLARKTSADVYGLENVWGPALLSKFLDFIYGSKSKTVLCDAWQYLGQTDKKFDVAVAYLGPSAAQKIVDYKDKIDILISMDFELQDMKPIRTIDIGHGITVYNRKVYPHKLFIYKFN